MPTGRTGEHPTPVIDDAVAGVTAHHATTQRVNRHRSVAEPAAMARVAHRAAPELAGGVGQSLAALGQ